MTGRYWIFTSATPALYFAQLPVVRLTEALLVPPPCSLLHIYLPCGSRTPCVVAIVPSLVVLR